MTTQCPICASAQTELFCDEVWGAENKQAFQCQGCGMFFLVPQDTPEERRAFDQQYGAYIAEREKLIAEYVDDSFEALVDDSIEERFADIGHFFAGARSVLEIGAENGGFLDRLKDITDQRVGVDAYPGYVEALRNKGYPAYDYIENVPADMTFSHICFFSLLEHILDPVSFLQEVARHLEPDGRIIIEVPSAADPLISLYDIEAFKKFYFQAMHPYVYSLNAIDVLLEKCALTRVKTQYKQRYGLSNHLQWLKAGVPGGCAAFDTLFNGAANDAYVRALEASGQTDTLYVVCQRTRP